MIIPLIKYGTVYTGEKEINELRKRIKCADGIIAKNKHQIEKELGPVFERNNKVFLSEVMARLRHLEGINAISSVEDFYAILEGKNPKPKAAPESEIEGNKKINAPTVKKAGILGFFGFKTSNITKSDIKKNEEAERNLEK